MTVWLRNAILLAAMIAASGMALALRPTVRVADSAAKVDLQSMIPRTFGDWREARFSGAQVVDPVLKEMIDKIYNQTLSRTYVNPQGYTIMLSVAYGSDQRHF